MTGIFLLLVLVASTCAERPELWVREPVNEPRIIQGEDANEGEFPYMASMKKPTGQHSCGASILTSRWVLTAAHCCDGANEKILIYAGSIYLSKGGSTHQVEKIVIHENYAPDLKWRNDICLIKISQPFTFGKNIQQITLAPPNWQVNSGDKVTVSGWGRIKPAESGYIPDRLQKGVNFTAYSNEECYAKTGLEIFPGYLCAVGTRKEQCTWNGDSGGPLVKEGAQVGLVSFGYRPYGNGMPTVYCRVTNYINWIKQNLGPDSSQLKFYQQNTLK